MPIIPLPHKMKRPVGRGERAAEWTGTGVQLSHYRSSWHLILMSETLDTE